MGIFVYVGNLGRETTEDAVRKAFVAGGSPVKKVVILRNPQNDHSRGFGFVEVSSAEEAETAIRTMNGVELEGQALKVSAARERARSREARSYEGYGGFGGRPGGRRKTGGGARRKTH